MKGKNRFSQMFCFKQQAGKEIKNYEIVLCEFWWNGLCRDASACEIKRKSNRKVYDPAEKETRASKHLSNIGVYKCWRVLSSQLW